MRLRALPPPHLRKPRLTVCDGRVCKSLRLPLDKLPGDLLPAVHFHSYTGCFVLWTVTMLYWRIFHFWFIHRNMHPWWDRKNGLAQLDLGAFLYRWVHAHHHKS